MIKKEDLIKEISKNTVFDHLVPPFRSSLIQKILNRKILPAEELNNSSTLSLSAAVYRNCLDHFHTLKMTSKTPIIIERTDSDLSSWEFIFNEVKERKASLHCPNNNELTKVQKAFFYLKKHCLTSYKNTNETITHICFFKSDSWKSGSHPHFFGCIFLNIDQAIEELALAIVHELAHQELFLLNLIDRLVLSDSDYNLVHAPFQKRERPPIGRLHSAHALFRMRQFKKSAKQSTSDLDLTLKNTIKTFNSGRELTTFANKIIHDIYNLSLNK
ncbi:HEXXH motif-containing putative peptide modification protein [bacterium]|nr:HEXXH motif-containing putative peptide modification protein [bacterium]